ncbi:L-type lectin-domain containing receptor kinase IX.1-like [Durio zibethinus]|uniref:non-specific serine/threonine protein kinase n=1 Tax=Durio zibethinus TaxID=66656 RepID=A0A6P5YTR9_DURZI|nr:L-type lectin-domain containing receptor kinase IX.1-like [Durio zibethinus]
MSANMSFICAFLVIFIQFFLPFAYSVSFNFTSFDATVTNILYEGEAHPSLGAIELTIVDVGCRVGRAVYSKPIRLWDASTMTVADFTTQYSFIIDTKNATKYGHGFAFFLAPVDYQIPPNSAGGYLGLLNSTTTAATSQNHIISVEFDSYINEGWDPPTQHVGINNNSMSSAAYAPWDAGSNSGKVANVWITYNATTKNLSVFWTYDEHPVFMGNSSVSYQIDLTKTLPEWVKIGFSASTGDKKEYNKIKSWEFTSNLETKQGKHSKKKSKRRYVILLVSVCSIVALMLGLVTGWLLLKKKKGNSVKENGYANGTHLEGGGLPKRFSYQELFTATNGFADDRRLGKGGSAHVYKGELDDQRLVAVKRIFAESESFFINELNIICRLIHRNLVKFIGWCHDQNQLLLVYEYMPNGCLESHLHGNKPTLPWDVRYKIAMGLASALYYLHEGAEQCVLHRDIKSANVLLDTDFTTKLGDFGVSKLVDPELRTQTTMIVGTTGYIAPEYLQEGRARRETDMYSFGIVALEIACGRKPNRNGALLRLVWHLYIAGYILDAADGRLENFDENEMQCLLTVGLWCTNPNDRERPNAGQVLKVLQGEAPLPELPLDMHDHPAPLPPLQIDPSGSGPGSQNMDEWSINSR